ncbi:hypothetical protein Cgig2_023008 [Carnegiea gigantea]|uniref:Uncharacterized protein n=1 Tax=Carnegiea gigantea TaxID=171969 RepID=A0A9Q1JLM0_9CARY|nr:hypothetical protein Cgig2_023008 [Carnegiea gigantea]
MATVLMRSGFIVLIIRGPGLAIQRCSPLVAQAVLFSCKWVKLHQLRVPPLALGKMTIRYILDVCFKVAFHTEGIKCQSHQELLKELGTLLASSPIALVLSLGQLLLFDLCLGLPPLLTFVTISKNRPRGRGSASLRQKQTTSTSLPSALEQRPEKHSNVIS